MERDRKQWEWTDLSTTQDALQALAEEFTSFYFEERGAGNLCAILVADSFSRREVAFNKSNLENRLRTLVAGGWPHELTAAASAAWPDASRRIADGVTVVGPPS